MRSRQWPRKAPKVAACADRCRVPCLGKMASYSLRNRFAAELATHGTRRAAA